MLKVWRERVVGNVEKRKGKMKKKVSGIGEVKREF